MTFRRRRLKDSFLNYVLEASKKDVRDIAKRFGVWRPWFWLSPRRAREAVMHHVQEEWRRGSIEDVSAVWFYW